MNNYIDGPVKINTMLHMLQNELDIGSNNIYSDAMEARFRYDKDTIKHFGDIIT